MTTALSAPSGLAPKSRWFGLTKTQWVIVLSAFLGYTMDCADLTIFNLVQIPSMLDLLNTTDLAAARAAGTAVIAYKLMAWGVGGIFFGILADRWGRTKTMMLTIALYALCTGLSAFAPTYEILLLLQIGAGLGIGGEYAAGAALVVEAMAKLTQRQRAYAMALIQSSFAAGFLLAALVNLGIGALDLGPSSWRYVLAVGFLPAIFILFLRRNVSDPEVSVQARGRGTLSDFFRDPSARRSTFVGIGICLALMIGSWGGLTLLPAWITQLANAAGTSAPFAISTTFIMMMAAGFPAYFLVAWLGERPWMSRKNLYRLVTAAGLIASLCLFLFGDSLSYVMWFAPIYGICVMGGFAVFGLILPDWFQTKFRATGIGISYNVSRLLSGIGLFSLFAVSGSLGAPATAAIAALAYLLGFVVIIFGKETKNAALPE